MNNRLKQRTSGPFVVCLRVCDFGCQNHGQELFLTRKEPKDTFSNRPRPCFEPFVPVPSCALFVRYHCSLSTLLIVFEPNPGNLFCLRALPVPLSDGELIFQMGTSNTDIHPLRQIGMTR